jgi:hypothetical protein
MIDFLIFSLITSLWCLGVYRSSFPEMILEPLDKLLSKLPSFLYKPLIGCIFCMASAHTALVWLLWTFSASEPIPVIQIIIAMPVVSILNGIIAQIVPE